MATPVPFVRLGARLAAALSGLLVGTAVVLTAPQTVEPPADDAARFSAFLDEVKTEAVRRGISEAVVTKALDGLEPLPIVLERDRGQAEAVLTIDAYVRSPHPPRCQRSAWPRRAPCSNGGRLRRSRVRGGLGTRVELRSLHRVRPTVQAQRRWLDVAAVFPNELFDALRIVDRGYIDYSSLRGLGRGDGAAAVHAVELSQVRRRFRR
jgi:hypothetical protein